MNIIELAKQAGFQDADWNYDKGLEKALKQFAALVIANIDPKSFMSWQEGYEAGVAQEREACAKFVEPTEEHRRDALWGYVGGTEGVELLDGLAAAIRARGTT